MSQLTQAGQEPIFPCSVFYSIQTLHELDDAHPHWGGPFALVSSPVQVLISSRTPSQIHPEIMFYQHPLGQSS